MWPFKRAERAQPAVRSNAQPTPQQKRAFYNAVSVFGAASIDRTTSSLPVYSFSMDWDLYRSLRIMRARSRFLSVNNDYARKFLQMCSTHVVGPTGFSLQVDVSDTTAKGKKVKDGLASQAIEDAFAEWSKRGNCDVTGYHSFFDICNLYIKAVARDGEVLIRKVYGKEAGKFGFQLQVLDIERLDELYNRPADTVGNVIKMGVEINQYGKPVAYHVRVKHPGDTPYYTYQGTAYERIPAEDIYHHFIADRPEQNRGIPWMHTAIIRLQNLGGYEEAAVIAARVGAAKMGFFTTPEGDGIALADSEGENGELYTEAEPGVFGTLPEGYDFKSFDPDYPHAMFGEFVKANLRGIASGLGVAYNTLSNDLEGVNFSSIRTGVLEERDNWMLIQRWMIESFLDDLFSTWLKFALLSGAVKLPNAASLPVAKFDKFNSASWKGRRWQWVDPTKDVEANILAINNGLKSRTDVISEQGKEIEDVFASLKAEQEQIDTLGIRIETPAAQVTDQQKPEGVTGTEPDKSEARNFDKLELKLDEMASKLREYRMLERADEISRARVDSLAQAITETHEKLTTREQPVVVNVAAPVVNVEPPSVTVEPPVVNVSAPVVNVEPPSVSVPEPQITLNMPKRKKETTVQRDADNNIVKSVTIESDA